MHVELECRFGPGEGGAVSKPLWIGRGSAETWLSLWLSIRATVALGAAGLVTRANILHSHSLHPFLGQEASQGVDIMQVSTRCRPHNAGHF